MAGAELRQSSTQARSSLSLSQLYHGGEVSESSAVEDVDASAPGLGVGDGVVALVDHHVLRCHPRHSLAPKRHRD